MLNSIKQKLQGSVLVFTLLALSVLLLGALSLATATLVGQKNAKNTDNSMQAFQTADSGAERMLAAINNNKGGQLSDLGSCSGGVVTGAIRNGSSQYNVTFFDADNNQLTDCLNDDVSSIREIKSTGEFGETTRAIKTAVAQTTCGQLEKVAESADESYSPSDTTDLESYLQNDGILTHGFCESDGSSINIGFGNGNSSFIEPDGDMRFGESLRNVLRCFSSSCKTYVTGASLPCSGGWAVYGMKAC
jgi:Tfp pilus assembly protein PilX